MARSVWKIPYITTTFITNLDDNKKFRIWLRSSTISKFFLNKKVSIYNGLNFITLLIKSNMLGKKFGEFSITKVLSIKKK